MSPDILGLIVAAAVTVVMGFLAGMAFMGSMMRRAVRDERTRLRECLDRGNRLVDTADDVIRRLRNTL